MSKIGENTKAKLEENGPYTAIGIIKLEDGKYGVVKLEVSGTEVLKRHILSRSTTFAEAMFEYQVTSGKYGMDYMHKEVLEK